MENTINQRIKEFCKFKKISISAFEKQCNLSNGYVNGISRGIGSEKIKTISLSFPELNTEWLLTGMGEMIRETETTQPETKDEIVIRLLNEIAEQREIIKRLIAIVEGDSEQPKKSRV